MGGRGLWRVLIGLLGLLSCKMCVVLYMNECYYLVADCISYEQLANQTQHIGFCNIDFLLALKLTSFCE
jgi:hypothetical protein